MPYIGNQHNVGDHINNFKVLDDISSYTATFDGSAASVVDTTNNTIRVPQHRFIQGQRVTYTNGGGGNIGGLTTGTAYFVSFDSANTIKLATSLANANSNTVINLSSVGSGISHTLNAAFDGINTKFKLSHGSGTPARLNNATQINVAINNVVQRPNLDPNNFTDGFALEDNHKIVFKTAPTNEDIFWGSIIANTIENFDLRDNEVDNFTGNGSTTEFTLSTIPANNESVIVTIDGVLQHPSDKDTARAYTLLANVIQFTAAPANNAEIQVRHIGFAGASTNDVSGFYGRTGNVTLTSNDNITTGNINAAILTASSANFSGNVSIGGTLTYEDVTNIDSVGIITARNGLIVTGVSTFQDIDVDGHTNLDNVSVAGVTTFSDDVYFDGATANRDIIFDRSANTLQVKPNAILKIGQGSYSTNIYTNGTNTFFDHNQNSGIFFKTNIFQIYGTGTTSGNTYDGTTFRAMTGKVELGYEVPNGGATTLDNLVTSEKGITVGTGVTIERNGQASFAGIVTFTGDVDANGDLDVDGHTNLDNVSVAGVSTFSGNADFSSGVDVTGNITGTGDLYLTADTPKIRLIDNNADDDFQISNFSGNFIIKDITNSVDRFTIQSDGTIDVANNLNVGAGVDVTGNIEATGNLDLTDSGRVKLGTGDDLQIYHTGSASKIDVYTTGLEIATDGVETLAKFNRHSSVELWHDGTKRIETTNTGASVTGNFAVSGQTNLTGDVTLGGTRPRLNFYDSDGNPDFAFINDSGMFQIFDQTNGGNRIQINSDGHVDILNHLDVNNGLDVTGNITATGKATFTTPGGDDAVLVKGDNYTSVRVQSARNSASDHAMFQMLGSRGTNASPTIIQNNDIVGTINVRAYDGNSYASMADIIFGVDGTPGDGDMPGRIEFRTTADGSQTPTEKLRIASDGVITAQKSASFGNTSDSFTALSILASTSGISELRLGDTTANAGYVKYEHSSNALIFATNATERLRITSGGQVNIGGSYTQTSKRLYVDGSVEFTSNLTCVNQIYLNGTAPQIVFTDTNQDSDFTIKNDFGSLQFIDRTSSNAVRLYANTGGFGGDRLYIANDIVHTGDTDTKIEFGTDIINFHTGGAERLRIDNDLVNIKGGNLHVGTDSATSNFTDSNGGNTRHIEIGATSGGDALLTTHSAGYGIGYFGYHVGSDRLVIACDQGGGSNSIDFITTAGTSTGGNSNNLNAKSPRFQIRGNGGLRAEYTDGDEVHAMSNSWHGNENYTHRSNRTLHSNGSGWGSVDGADPILVLSVANRANNSNLGDAYGIQLHSESQDDNDYAPMIGWSCRSNSGNYNTTIAAMVAQKTGQAVDSNWSSGALHFFTNKPGGYMDNIADMSINEDGYVTKPRQPAFNVTKTGGQINSNIGLVVFDDDSSFINCNIGNHYSKTGTTQGRFTAPVAGRYQINARMLTNSSTQSYTILLLQKNGATVGYIGHNHTDSWIMESGSWVLDLVENDYVTVYLQQHSGHGGYNYASFSGFLIG